MPRLIRLDWTPVFWLPGRNFIVGMKLVLGIAPQDKILPKRQIHGRGEIPVRETKPGRSSKRCRREPQTLWCSEPGRAGAFLRPDQNSVAPVVCRASWLKPWLRAHLRWPWSPPPVREVVYAGERRTTGTRPRQRRPGSTVHSQRSATATPSAQCRQPRSQHSSSRCR